MQAKMSKEKPRLFRRLLREHGDKIYSFALSLIGDKDVAADMVSEAFARAPRSFDRYQTKRDFHSWLFQIVRNLHIDKKRRLESPKTVAIEEVARADANGRRLEDLWASDDPTPADYMQISRTLDIPVETARSRIFRGRQMLREFMPPCIASRRVEIMDWDDREVRRESWGRDSFAFTPMAPRPRPIFRDFSYTVTYAVSFFSFLAFATIFKRFLW